VIMAVCVIGGIQSALTLINVSAQAQEVVTGCLLIISVVLPNSGATLGRVASPMGTGCPPEVMNVLDRLRPATLLRPGTMVFASHGPTRQGSSGSDSTHGAIGSTVTIDN
jgi:hypothetical protein